MSTIFTINAGSSSLKFSLYAAGDLAVICEGQVERLGPEARLILDQDGTRSTRDIGPADHGRALDQVIAALDHVLGAAPVVAVGHRIVHGGPDRAVPAILGADVLEELAQYAPFAPLHQPHNLACVRAAQMCFGDAVHVGCFDTAFHRGHPWVNDTFGLPRALYAEGVRRYGFHGLSYDYITSVLAAEAPDLAQGRVVVAHLGNGASMCAMRGGASQGSTMGFSALDGLPMGTRCGQIDPGVLLYLMDQKSMSAEQITALLYKESGLLGLSGLSGDMRTLEASPAPEAAQAIDYFVFRIAREIGAMAAVLGGIDGLVFTGGIGENSALVRARATAQLGFLGIAVDPARNQANARDIGTGAARVMVVPTDEERVIARAAQDALNA